MSTEALPNADSPMIGARAADSAEEVARLRRRLDRERSTRAEAEAIAETTLRELYTKQKELALLQEIAFAANAAEEVDAVMALALRAICEFIDWPVGHIYVADLRTGELKPTSIWHVDDEMLMSTFQRFTEQMPFSVGQGLPGQVVETCAAVWIEDVTTHPNFPRASAASAIGIVSGFAFPVTTRDGVVAVLEFYTRKRLERDDARLELMTHIGTQLSRVVERCRAQELNRVQMARLAALHAIDVAIAGGLDLASTMSICLKKIAEHSGVVNAVVLLYNREGGSLVAVAGHGDITIADEDGCAFPLVVKGEIKGVLKVTTDGRTSEADTFLQTVAGQIAVAIDNARLLESLQTSNAELTFAYDATIEGWSRALDLRDHETEGHSRRVTETTMALAAIFGYDDDALVDLRRGALLHDIGKMGIPDGILLKPGPLTDDEWVIMKKHPEYALDLLSPIAFLGDALDIPYCHHEKWDGTGYPRGLKGEDIPLAARMFAIVDVWDALRSDRPYRTAWSHERVMDHLRSLAGTHFDPQVVDAFLRLMDADQTSKAAA